MSLTKILAVSTILAVFLALQGTAVAGKVNEDDENAEEGAAVSSLTVTSTGRDRYKENDNKRKAIPEAMNARLGYAFNIPSGQECSNYTNLTNPDRAKRAVIIDQELCDSGSNGFVSGWYRFTGEAGDKMASTCVPILRCTTAAPGWLNGSHPTANSSLARRRVCFHWQENCCEYNVDIWVRHCGDFYIYQLPQIPWCYMRYCGDASGPFKNPSQCGGEFTNLTDEITSPGYPTYMEPISCSWTIKAPFDGNILLYFEDMIFSHDGCPSNNILIKGNEEHSFCYRRDPFHLLIAQKTVNIHYKSVYWNKASGFKLRYAMIKENLDNVTAISKWNISVSVQVNGTSTIGVSWHMIDSSFMKPNESVYGYVVLCKPANMRTVYVLTKSSAATITIPGLAGGTEYKVQVVALATEQNTMTSSIYGSVEVTFTTKKYECAYFHTLSSWDRAQGAPGGFSCDKWNIVTPAWYRFAGQAGTQIASSCVPKRRCGTHASGWMDGTHPSVRDGIVARRVCFHWFENCCKWHVNIKVRDCGGFYVYQLRSPPWPWCNLGFCGNKGGCGKSVNDTSGSLTSPGYPVRIYWNSKCQWNLTAPSPSGVIVVIVEHLSIPRSARCLKFSLSFENNSGGQVGQECGVQYFFTWVSKGSAKLKFFSDRAASRWVGFKARYFIFKDDLTHIPDISQWTGVSAQAVNSTAITVQWGTYPASHGSSPITEYIIICVPDGLPLNATVFTTDASQRSLVVAGLLKYMQYTVQIVVQTNGKNSTFDDYRGSQKTRVRTKEDVPSQGPNVTANPMGTTITVSWESIPENARHGNITSFVIFYKKAWTSDSYKEKRINSSEAGKVQLKDLESATEYRIEMAGVTVAGTGAKSKAVFAVTGCDSITTATKKSLTWTFSSPRYPGDYLSNLKCKWSIGFTPTLKKSSPVIYVVFEVFHLEKSDLCSAADYVSIFPFDNATDFFCGKKDPFAIKLPSGSNQVILKTDGGLEEKGFHARVFVVIGKLSVKEFKCAEDNIAKEVVISWSQPAKAKNIVQYVVLYKTTTGNSWNATITNTTKAFLPGLQRGKSYDIFGILLYTTGSMTYLLKLNDKQNCKEPSGPNVTPTTPPPEEKFTTQPSLVDGVMYKYGENAEIARDSMIPNTDYYSRRCFRVDIPDDGMPFFEKRHHMIHICRNGLLLFETPQRIHWPYRFSERHQLLDKTAILAPYWSLTDVDEAFVTLNTSKVYYKVYKDTDNNIESKEMLLQGTRDVKELCPCAMLENHRREFQATWVLKVTWCNLRFPGADKLSPIPENTFQAVIVTNGLHSFAMFNYPKDGIQWSAPTEKKHYKYFTESRGLPVVGLNAGERNPDQNFFYDAKGSGTVGIEGIDQKAGLAVYSKDDKYLYHDNITHQYFRGVRWIFRLETIRFTSSKKSCITWFKSTPDPRGFTEYLEPCPCTYRQAFWDERFKIEFKGWARVCAYLVFESDEGWNQECCYDRMTGSLIKGYPGGGTAQFEYNKRPEKGKIENDFKWCCVYSSMCHLYYKKLPSHDCSGYKETEWSWLWGDPHFVTLDGKNYTFNGLGEYIMADVNDGLFQLQARTKLVQGGGKATVFVSAVAKQTGTSTVQVNLIFGEGMELLVNGTRIDHNTLTNTTSQYNVSISLSHSDNNSITVLFPCGISVKMTEVKNSLVILLAAPQRFKNKTRGLLGVWNDDPSDDLTTPTGQVLPTDASGRTIHYEFGQKWQVTENTSLFTYKDGENVNTFCNTSFKPMFIEDFKFANETVKQEALDKCKGDVNCLFDAALTNDVTMGTSTKIVGSRLKNESIALKNSPPMFLNDSFTISVTINTTARIEIFAKDDDDDPLTFNVSGILPENLDINTNYSSKSIVLVWNVTMAKIKFKVTVTDDKGDVALLRPEVHLCACHNGGDCSSDANNNLFADSSNETFLIMPCTCINGYTGRFCENDLDACLANLNPCYPGVKCTDLPPPADLFGFKCGPCPYGFTGNGATCSDLDECEGDRNGCSQICVNTPGSFVCDCEQGYGLSIDQKTCNDINECVPSSDCMQKCKNVMGSYECGCDAGFKVDPTNPKKCVPEKPCEGGNQDCQEICYVKDGQQKCACPQGYKLMDDQKRCEDIDECSTGKYRCNQYCHNTEGSYTCSCKKGFRIGADRVTCDDVDECMELTYQCPDPSQICLNTPGSYKCDCGPGLYLTVNNTCREIDPDVTPPSPGPASTPKPPSTNEKNNAIKITVKKLNISEWNERLEKNFKQSVAKTVTLLCASEEHDCQDKQKRERRALDYIPYTADEVHLLPGFPIQSNPESRDLEAFIAFYVDFPPEVVSRSGDSIQGKILLKIVQSAKVDIEKALNRTISDITLNNMEKPSTKSNPNKLNLYVIIGASLAGLVFIGIVALLIKRDISHNATLSIKRKQDNEERRNRSRARDVNNVCYDDGLHGEFRLAAVSTSNTPRETGNEYTQTAELGIDNPDFDAI